jgi:hypothetical protein
VRVLLDYFIDVTFDVALAYLFIEFEQLPCLLFSAQ